MTQEEKEEGGGMREEEGGKREGGKGETSQPASQHKSQNDRQPELYWIWYENVLIRAHFRPILQGRTGWLAGWLAGPRLAVGKHPPKPMCP